MSASLGRACRAARLTSCRFTAAQQQQHIATFTYRAPKTIRSLQTPLQQLQLHRTFFWNKKPEPEAEAAAAPATPAATPAAKAAPALVPVPAAAPAPVAPAKSQSIVKSTGSSSDHGGANKSARLGFSGLSSMFNSLNLSWPRIKTYSVWVAVGSGVLLVFKLGLNIVDFFATVSFLDVGEVAFLGGLVSGLGVAGCAVLGTRFLRLRPEPIFQHALKRLSADQTVAAYMGRTLTTSEFRAYNFVEGSLRMGATEKERAANKVGLYKYYQPRRLQVMFQVLGSNGVTGMATAEVEKNWRGDHSYNLLAIDLIDGRDSSAAERIILEGDPSYRIYKGIIKLR